MRRLWLLALLSAAVGLAAPAGGQAVPGTPAKRVLIVTGIDYPGHKWPETAPVLSEMLAKDQRLDVSVVEEPTFLASPELHGYDVVVLHFMDWEQPDPGPEARANLKRFVEGGKGLFLVHFACGAFQEWPEFRDLAGRVWDPELRGHDPYGEFRVEITDIRHPVTEGLEPFDTVDELYTCLAGDRPIELLATATSKVDGKPYPMAFAFSYGEGRVFHSPLGHDVRGLTHAPAVGELFRRGCAWAAGLPPVEAAKKAVLIAGKASHGAGAHEHEKGVLLLQQCLETSPDAAVIRTEVVTGGWPQDPSVLDDADTILVYADGFEGNPLFASEESREKVTSLMAKGTGLVCVHFAVAPPKDDADEALFLRWLGGYYEDGYSKNPVCEAEVAPTSDHPVGHGLAPYAALEEFYYRIRFVEDPEAVTPIATALLPLDDPKPETIAWAMTREDGGRSFGFTGGHFHESWRIDSYRKMVLNAIVWTAGADVPAEGVRSALK